ncbi:MAG: hypothetical protein GY943_02170 [Chloroflexi bacterium]|nr:hypothetical protein [Chloroflexota bacterium]
MLNQQENKKLILIFIATHYEEVAFDAIYTLLQTHQLAIKIGGLTTGLVRGCEGALMAPHYALSSLLKMMSLQHPHVPDSIILTGGVQCINQLFADPRLHDFLEWFVNLDRLVGICQPLPYELVVSSKAFQSDRLLLQNGETYDQFIEQFIQRVT